MVSCSNFGEILREFGEILGKYRNLDGRSLGSIGLSNDYFLIYMHFFGGNLPGVALKLT